MSLSDLQTYVMGLLTDWDNLTHGPDLASTSGFP